MNKDFNPPSVTPNSMAVDGNNNVKHNNAPTTHVIIPTTYVKILIDVIMF